LKNHERFPHTKPTSHPDYGASGLCDPDCGVIRVEVIGGYGFAVIH
jgi:hypothetical protein